jgi:hypothetical protein
MRSDYKVEMIDDSMQEFYVEFHGPKDEIHLEFTMRLCVMKLLEVKDILIDIVFISLEVFKVSLNLPKERELCAFVNTVVVNKSCIHDFHV